MCNKVVDGLFYSNYMVAQDIDFMSSNKITHIINCASREVRNLWDRLGIK